MPPGAARFGLLLSVIYGSFRMSLGQEYDTPLSSSQAPGCDPACVRGICKQAINSAALYCDCSDTGFRGPLCNTSQNVAPSSGGFTSSPTSSCSPVCQNGGVCRQEVNSAAYYCDCSRTGFGGVACTAAPSARSPAAAAQAAPQQASPCTPACQNGGACRQQVNSAAYYCDCSRTGYKGATCSAPVFSPGPSANLSASASSCSPPCQHGGLCKQEVNSAAYYCECSRTGFRGAFCTAQTNASSPSTAIQAVPTNASSCTPACQNGGTCKQAVNSGAYYCDCSRTSYKGATCSALAAYSPAASAASNMSACSPPCRNGAPCKQEVNSGAYYCKCQGTSFTGQDCSIAQGSGAAVTGAGVQSTTSGGGGVGQGGGSRIAWWGILIIVAACVAGLGLIGFLGVLLVRQARSSQRGSFARFREEGKFYNGSPEHNHGIEATRM